eukprot:12166409-Alexandrium_andersonii.AAC.1
MRARAGHAASAWTHVTESTQNASGARTSSQSGNTKPSRRTPPATGFLEDLLADDSKSIPMMRDYERECAAVG